MIANIFGRDPKKQKVWGMESMSPWLLTYAERERLAARMSGELDEEDEDMLDADEQAALDTLVKRRDRGGK